MLKVKEAWSVNQGHLSHKLHKTLDHLHNWGYSLFGSLPRKIKLAQDELMHLNHQHGIMDLSQQIKEKEVELDNLLEGEEMWWKQRSRADWLQHRDKNTKYFHMKASQRRKRNRITELKDNNGHVVRDYEDIEKILVEHFQNIFQKQQTHNIDKIVEVVKDKLNQEMKKNLGDKFTEIEVYNAIKDMKSMAALGRMDCQLYSIIPIGISLERMLLKQP
jgi:hypothetical protein